MVNFPDAVITEPISSSIWPSTSLFSDFPNVAGGEDSWSKDLTSVSSFDPSIDWLAEMTTRSSVDFDRIVGPSFVIDHIQEDSTNKLWGLYKPGVSYSASRIKCWPAMFAQKGTTPFIHRNWIAQVERGGRGSTEDVMLDALGACALYAAKNEENRGAVVQDVRRKVRILIDGRRQWKKHGLLELLVSLQALLLYDIIRLFDGDIRLRTEADADNEVLRNWTEELTKYLKPLKSLDPIADQNMVFEEELDGLNAKGWRNWLIDESVRRTILTSYIVQVNYSFLKGRMESDCEGDAHITFTGRKALWEAPSEYHWNVLWTEKRPCEIIASWWASGDSNITAFNLTADESDEFVVIMMAMLKDVNLTAQWLGEANLVRYSLDWESMKKYVA
jgi:hypothetical protein